MVQILLNLPDPIQMLFNSGPIHLIAGENGRDYQILQEKASQHSQGVSNLSDLQRDLISQFLMQDVHGMIVIKLHEILQDTPTHILGMLFLALLHDLVKGLDLLLTLQDFAELGIALGSGGQVRETLIHHIRLYIFLGVLKTRTWSVLCLALVFGAHLFFFD